MTTYHLLSCKTFLPTSGGGDKSEHDFRKQQETPDGFLGVASLLLRSKEKRVKVFRLEAFRSGLKEVWQKRGCDAIIAFAEYIPETVLQK